MSVHTYSSRLGRAVLKQNHNTAVLVFISHNKEMPVLIPFLKHSAFMKEKSVKLNYYISNAKTHRLIKSLQMYNRPSCRSSASFDRRAYLLHLP